MWLGNTLKLLLLVALSLAQAQITPRIVGGTLTTISQVPYLMQLRYDGVFTCGGSLVNAKFVVTAAHCVQSRVASRFTVTGGATNLSTAGVICNVERIIRPSSWNLNNMNFDVAVLQLKSAMTGANISLINLCSGAVPNGAPVQISGWGSSSETGSTSNDLQTVQVNKISNRVCQRSYSGLKQLTKTMICASASGKDACYGDSGGPMTYNNELCGIVSWGIGCARVYPGVYTNINVVSAFIRQAISTYNQ